MACSNPENVILKSGKATAATHITLTNQTLIYSGKRQETVISSNWVGQNIDKEKEEAIVAANKTLRVSPAAQTWTKVFLKVSKP